jgi:hydrogenase maturation protease
MRIICCGNRDRGDDGAALLVAERLRELGIDTQVQVGEPLALIEAWSAADEVIVVDAVVTGVSVGTVQVWDEQLPSALISAPASTHGLGAAEAIKLAQVLRRLPSRLRVYGIEGRHFAPGTDVSNEVQQAVERVVQKIAAEVAECRHHRGLSNPPTLSIPPSDKQNTIQFP